MTAPARPRIAFYGDDFTGSSAVAELLAFAGLPTILFLRVPSAAQLARFPGRKAVGIAGVARSESPEWMERHLPPAFAALAAIGAELSHYKICSTFDSAPHVGSIGKAVDLAAPVLGGAWHPLIPAAPAIHRYQLFGNLFAAVDGVGYRLDRHPTVSRHPVTPMDEADVRRHLAKQTARRIGLVDYFALLSGRGRRAVEAAIRAGEEIVAIDVLDEASLAAAGELVWEDRAPRMLAIGSQGVEYALLAHWRRTGALGSAPPRRRAAPAPTAAVSGSASPVTARQIAAAEANGFAAIRLDVTACLGGGWEAALDAAVDAAGRALDSGRAPLVYTARGSDDPAVAAMRRAVAASGEPEASVNARIGAGLGAILDALVRGHGIRRVAVAGGDTSGHALARLGILALEAEVELWPACAISRAHAGDLAIDGLEVALKGGQMGPPDFFGLVAAGGRHVMETVE